MQVADWIVIVIYSLISLGLGFAFTRKASEGIESYFASGRRLGWLLAGTSMAATAFSSDTPLLITGMVRRSGIWGVWEVWALALSTMLTVFLFSKLWKRAGVLTEVELVELRYDGRAAAFLRGFKAIYWGIFYNAFIMGAWPITGLVKVMQETTDWTKAQSIFFSIGLTTLYATLAGYWGVIVTDFFQFVIAMAGAVILALYAVGACGGMPSIVAALSATDKLSIIPPFTGGTFEQMLASPFGWFLGLVLIQWWAWKNTDGGGIIVQRIASCRNERQAIFATLWFNIAQYALRSWPWIVTALASLVLLPDLADHERAYPRLITLLLPAGMRGLLVASFFAAFMSTMSTHLNWGSSYFVNDFYRRFLRKSADEPHYVLVGRLTSIALAGMATCIAFFTESIGAVFTFVLNLTAAIGPVYLLRWFWWRINAWSEVAALAASLPVIMLRPAFFAWTDITPNAPAELLFMVIGAAFVWLPATLLTQPVSEQRLSQFFQKVRPPGFWRGLGRPTDTWLPSLKLWLISSVALLATTFGPLEWLLGRRIGGASACALAVILWFAVAFCLRQTEEKRNSQALASNCQSL